jgi:hypothetical protein
MIVRGRIYGPLQEVPGGWVILLAKAYQPYQVKGIAAPGVYTEVFATDILRLHQLTRTIVGHGPGEGLTAKVLP